MSKDFEAHRNDYYDGLLAVSKDDDWTGWCRFFLSAVRAQAEYNLAKAQGILELYETMKLRVSEATRSRYAIHALDWIFQIPIFSSNSFAAGSEIPPATARRVVNALVDHDILKVFRVGRGRRAAILMFEDVLDIAEGGTHVDAHV